MWLIVKDNLIEKKKAGEESRFFIRILLQSHNPNWALAHNRRQLETKKCAIRHIYISDHKAKEHLDEINFHPCACWSIYPPVNESIKVSEGIGSKPTRVTGSQGRYNNELHYKWKGNRTRFGRGHLRMQDKDLEWGSAIFIQCFVSSRTPHVSLVK